MVYPTLGTGFHLRAASPCAMIQTAFPVPV